MKHIILATGLIFGFFYSGFAQKALNVGFVLGVDYNQIKTEQTDWSAAGIANDLREIVTEDELGPSLGVLLMYNFTPKIALRAQGMLSFSGNTIKYVLNDNTESIQEVRPTNIEIPVHLILKGGDGLISPSLIAGLSYRRDISNYDDIPRLNLNDASVSGDFGFGVVLNLAKIRIKPEIIYSSGISNMLDTDNDLFNAALENVQQNRWLLRVNIY